jgi:hypothetical protein
VDFVDFFYYLISPILIFDFTDFCVMNFLYQEDFFDFYWYFHRGNTEYLKNPESRELLDATDALMPGTWIAKKMRPAGITPYGSGK